MSKNIRIIDFQKKGFKVSFLYTGKGTQEVLVKLCWRGSTIYRHKFILEEGSPFTYFSSTGEGEEFVDELEAIFMGVDWEEKHTFHGTESPYVNYSELPRVKDHPKDCSFPTYCEIFAEKLYENNLASVEKGDVVVDIGANNGYFALFASLKGADKILSYEPSKNTFPYLCSNTYAHENIRAFQKAVSAENGTAYFHEDYEMYASAGSHLTDDTGNEHVYQVDTISLKDIILSNNLSKIDYLKIDCEGSEGQILSSLPSEYFAMINKMCVETHGPELSIQVRQILEENGFDYVIKENFNLVSGALVRPPLGCGFDIYYAKNLNFPKKNTITQ